jgi:hypothetical protein
MGLGDAAADVGGLYVRRPVIASKCDVRAQKGESWAAKD